MESNEKRLILFIVISVIILFGSSYLFPPKKNLVNKPLPVTSSPEKGKERKAETAPEIGAGTVIPPGDEKEKRDPPSEGFSKTAIRAAVA